MERSTGGSGSASGFRVIGAFKLATALLLASAGFGIFRLLGKDLGEALEHFVTRLHLDPENEIVQTVATRLAHIEQGRLKAIGAGTMFYAVLEAVEGVGLILKRRWAGYLTVVATGLLLVPEVFELAHKVNAVRVAVLLTNLGVLAYVIVKLRQERRAEAGATPPSS